MNSYEKFNLFIFDYLTNNKTNTSLLLDGEWGVGKTYYVKNVLIPFLKSRNKQVVYISLYGIENVESLSKSIFTESRLKLMNKTAGTIISGTAKTVIRGISSYFGVDLNGGIKEWNKLAKFANLKGKLLIIDDLERHSPKFNIIEILGYINNLCEQDEVKVLLVCDERVLNTIGLSKDESEKYKKIKEKTIGDTVKFSSNLNESIMSILENYELLRFVNQEELINALKNQREIYCFNLRSFSRACQKMVGIWKCINNYKKDDTNEEIVFLEFLKMSFIGLVVFYLKLSKDSSINYSHNYGISSSELGTNSYPLYKYVYDYCIYQTFDISEFNQAYSLFLKQRQNKENSKVISIIQSYYLVDDSELESAIEKLGCLVRDGSITCESFTGIATYLIAIKHYLNYDIQSILDVMVERVENSDFSQELLDSLDSYVGSSFENRDCIKDFNDFKNRLKAVVLSVNHKHENDCISADNLSGIIKNILRNQNKWMVSKEGFSKFIDFQRFLVFIKKPECNAGKLDEIRGMLFSLYTTISNVADFCSNDITELKKFKNGIDELLKKNNIEGKSKKLQLIWLSKNLENIIVLLQKK